MSLLQGAHDVTSAEPPLHCNVCPKKPDFSDVSHLLTHVSSKGHLSSVYKLRVQATSDAAAKRSINRYDNWYTDYNLDDLMAERLRQKESKRTSGGTGSRRAGNASGSTRSTPAANTGPRRSNKLRNNMHMLDPRLNLNGVTKRATATLSRSATPASAFNGFDPAHFGRFAAPQLQNWAVNSMSNSPMSATIKQESPESEEMDDYDDDDDDESFELPVARSMRPRRQFGSVSFGPYLDVEEEEENLELTNEGDKLKGIKWPGMDMFDSATQEMKRKRNQKKSSSVLKQLQATSEIIEATECVFDQSGTLRRERPITGSPPVSEADLIEGESEPEMTAAEKKRPRPKPRSALAERHPNSRRPRSRNQGEPIFTLRHDSIMVDDDVVDYSMTYGHAPAKRHGPTIHHDNSGPAISFEQPPSMNYLTSSFRSPFTPGVQNPLQPHGYDNSVVPRSHSRQPSWGQFPAGFRPTSTGTGISGMGHSAFGNMYPHTSHTSAGVPGALSAGHSQPALPSMYGMGSGSHSLQQNSMFPGHGSSNQWDMFGLDHDSTGGFLGGADLGFPYHTDNPIEDAKDGTLATPLFVSDQQDDDQVTISAGSDK